MLQPGSVLPVPKNCPHQAVLSLEGSWQGWEHPTCCSPKPGTGSSRTLSSQGQCCPQGLPRDCTRTGVTALGRFALISQSILYTTSGKLHGPDYLTQCVNPSGQREPPDCPTHSAKLVCLFLGIFMELRIFPPKTTSPHSFSSFPNPARHTCVCVCHQPTSRCMLGISASFF